LKKVTTFGYQLKPLLCQYVFKKLFATISYICTHPNWYT